MALFSCSSFHEEMPIVQIDSILHVTHNSAIVYARVSDDGGSTPYQGGTVWSDTPGVTLDDTITAVSNRTYGFVVAVADLEANKTYYIRPYCEDHRGKVMGEEMSFTTQTVETFTDQRDGNVYPVLYFGNLLWMGENLRYVSNEGSVPVESENFQDLSIMGRLYTFETAKNICPEGWRIPSDDDWIDLERYIGVPEAEIYELNRSSNAGNKLKYIWNKYQHTSYNYGTNSTGFTALPAGSISDGNHVGFGKRAVFWSGAETDDQFIVRRLNNDDGILDRLSMYKTNSYFSLRCVKDAQY